MINALKEGVSQRSFSMKNLYKVLGIIVITAVIVFSVVSCKEEAKADPDKSITITGIEGISGDYGIALISDIAALLGGDESSIVAQAMEQSAAALLLFL
jgi:hypothetical protein